MAAAASSSKSAPKGGKKTNEEVIAGFQALRAEQRQLATKISELEMDLNEHKIVSETLTGVEGTRRCFRMVGGILVESTVADVLPELEGTRQRLPDAITALTAQLQEKGKQINEYIETHNIRIQKGSEPPAPEPAAAADRNKNVLVASA